MNGPRVARRLVGFALLGTSLTLAACGGSNATALGHEACRDVTASITAYHRAQIAATPAEAKLESNRALNDLQAALRPASLAGTASGDWQALMTTLSETSRGVSERLLIPALTAQCASSTT